MDSLVEANFEAIFGKTLTYAKARVIICLSKNPYSANFCNYDQTIFEEHSLSVQHILLKAIHN
jgi:hypothetical protein